MYKTLLYNSPEMMTPSAGSGRTGVLTLRVTVIIFIFPGAGMLCPIRASTMRGFNTAILFITARVSSLL